MENIEEIAPLIYTPTVGKVCQDFGENVCGNTIYIHISYIYIYMLSIFIYINAETNVRPDF